MMITTLALRFKIIACAALVALISGIVASPADAGSREKFWPQRHATENRPAAKQPNQARPLRGRGQGEVRTTQRAAPVQQPAPTRKLRGRNQGHGAPIAVPSSEPPKFKGAANPLRRNRQLAQPAPSVTPQLAVRGRASGIIRQKQRPTTAPARGHPPARQDPAYKPSDPSVAAGRPGLHDRKGRGQGRHNSSKGHDRRYDDHGKGRRGRHDDHRKYDKHHHHHETHVVHHHVQRHYYYRTSSRHYRFTYLYRQPYSYPVYYLVPYHIHRTPGYHTHGEQTTYCNDGFAQGGVYRGGAYTRGASHQASGAIIGGILGAAAGYQVGNGKGQLVAVGVGTLLGALIGSDIGYAMDRQDQAYATGSFGHAMETVPSCTTISWNNPQTGNHGSVTPTHTYEPEPGRYCREFQQQVVIGGKLQDAYGTACRQPDGSWEIIAEQP